MVKAMMVLADGFEESEAMITASYLRRAGIELDLVTINNKLQATSSHNVTIQADRTFDQINPADYDAIVTPGGLVGVTNLADDKRVIDAIAAFYRDGKWLAHVCASPIVLRAAGVADKISGVCYPGFEEKVEFGSVCNEIVHMDGHVITSRGPLTTPFFALTIIKHLVSEDAASEVAGQVLLPLVREALRGDQFNFGV